MSSPRVRALVTGGSGGIGAAICKVLGAAGHEVYVHANRSTAAAELVAAEIVEAGGTAQVVSFDVTDAAASSAVLEPLVDEAPIQILVNNAGIHDDAAFPGMSPAQWHGVIDVAVAGFYNVTHPLILPMIRTRWGRIINVSSVTALRGNRGQVNYAAAKGALDAATRALSLEVASRGITVNSVAPGIIAAGMGAAGSGAAGPGAPGVDPALIAQWVPMKRAGTAHEVASLVGYLASGDAAYISGQVISINGGMA